MIILFVKYYNKHYILDILRIFENYMHSAYFFTIKFLINKKSTI